MTYAIIDIGSNTMRLCVYKTMEGRTKELFRSKETVGLASYVEDGILNEAGIQAAVDALNEFRHILQCVTVDKIAAFATASLRNIDNTDEAVETIEEATGLHIDLISGVEEAVMDYYGIVGNCSAEQGIIVDIGGGSSELTHFTKTGPHMCNSFPIGSLNVYKQCVSDEIFPNKDEQEQMSKLISSILDKDALTPFKKEKTLVGVGGTARAVLKLANFYHKLDKKNRVITTEQLTEVKSFLFKRNRKSIDLVLKNCPDRVHTILPGLMILEHIATKLDIEQIEVSRCGVREGYLYRSVMPSSDRKLVQLDD